MLKNINLVISLLLLGACSTSGMVAADVDISLTDVRITHVEQVRGDAEFSHLLREEILHQFSKLNAGVKEKKRASISLEITKLEYPGNQAGDSLKKSSVMSGSGTLNDEQTGTKLGAFKLKVSHKDERYLVSGLPGENFDNSHLIQLMAQALLKKVYGAGRAGKIVKNPGRYVRQSYFRQPKIYTSRTSARSRDVMNKPNNKKIGGLRLSLANGVLPPEFIGPPMESIEGDNVPKVIEAPQLPIQ